MTFFWNTPLFEHLWQSTLFSLTACLVLLVFRKGSTWSRHLIAWVAYLKFLIPFSFVLALVEKPIEQANAGAVPVIGELAPMKALSIGLDLEYWLNQTPDPQLAGLNPDSESKGLFMLLGLWVAGAIFFIGRRWLQYRRLDQSVKRSSRPADEKWIGLAGLIIGNRSLPKLLISDDDKLSGGVIGLIFPKVIIPAKMDTIFNNSDREAFLRHELQHIFKYDNLWLFLQKCIRDFFWFHPLVCWLDRQISWEREMMRDEEVLHKMKNKNTYLSCLMKASKIDLPQNYATSIGLTGSPFSRRIRAIASYRSKTFSRIVSGVVSVGAIALLVGLFSVSINTVQAQNITKAEKEEYDRKSVKSLDESLEEARLGATSEKNIEPELIEKEKQLLREVLPLMRSGKEEAKQRLIASVDEDTSGAILFLIGNFYAEEGNKEEAVLYYEAAVERFPDFARAHKNLGFMKVQARDYEGAKKHLLKVYGWGNLVDNALCGLIGLCYLNLEEYATADHFYREAIELDPSISDWKVGLAKSLLKQSKFEEAIPVLEEAKAMRMASSEDYNPLGGFGEMPQP
ncbi:tetratricopeptide repeat protein [Puniceicoccaceae bacterium K14]|nr:tetratricopeptide repeat protein [Puniceicoccaceae bacterium K14]